MIQTVNKKNKERKSHSKSQQTSIFNKKIISEQFLEQEFKTVSTPR